MNKKYITIGVIILVWVGVYIMAKLSIQNNNQNNTVSEEKININAVCDGALAYMTFPDSEAVDKFLAECKEGKRPEVIEKYKADMNLGAGAAI